MSHPHLSISENLTERARSLRSMMQRSSTVLRRTTDGSTTYVQTVVKQVTAVDLGEIKKELDMDAHYITLEHLADR